MDKLSNGNKVVAITVYVPANTIVNNSESFHVIKIVHKTTTKIVHECLTGQHWNGKTCVINPPPDNCELNDSTAKTDPDTNLKTMDCDLGDANEHGIAPPPPPPCNSPNYNGTCLPTNNMTVPASGGKGAGPSCIDNCTTGTPPPLDCKTNPNDPSCTQSLTPPPTTKTCPYGSPIDARWTYRS